MRRHIHPTRTASRRRALVTAMTALALASTLTGCVVHPRKATSDEVEKRVKSDTALMYTGQERIIGPLTMEEAVARALKYNLDYRLKKMESALALGLAQYSNYDMLPTLLANAGYHTRDNYSGGAAIGIDDGLESLRPSSSEDRTHRTDSAEFSWSLLDFGVSYYRAREQADQFLIAEERRRKVVQNMLQDVRSAYWRALGAQRLAAQADDIKARAQQAMAKSHEAEIQRAISPSLALNYQRALLDAVSLLNLRREDLEFARRELAALMNLEPGVVFVLADNEEAPLPQVPTDIGRLEELALLQRPELREEDFKKRITADEARRQLLGMLPAISIDGGIDYDTNHLLASNTWTQGGVTVSWNLLRLASLPSLRRTHAEQEQADQARRMALSMAVLTQVRIGVERYRFATEDFELAAHGAEVDGRLADYARASVTARLDSDLEAVRTRARAVLGDYQRAFAYANAQIAFGRLYNSLGFDPLPDDFEGDSLSDLTAKVRRHLRSTETGALQMTSQLFRAVPPVSIRLVGVSDPGTQARMRDQIAELLIRNRVAVDAEHGEPLILSLLRTPKEGMEVATWTLALEDDQGRRLGAAQHASLMPGEARGSAYEAALAATVTSQLPQLRGWLASAGTGMQAE